MRPQEPMIGVRYIGAAVYWQAKPSLKLADLDFTPGQVRVVPMELGRAYLKHSDLFERADVDVLEPDKETIESLSDIKAKKDKEIEQQLDYYDVLAQVDRLDKDGLQRLANDQYRVKLDKRYSLDRMRQEVRGYIEQYGTA